MHHTYDALGGKPTALEWLSDIEQACANAKEALAHATVLVQPHADEATALTVDASGEAVGAVLE